MMLRIRKALSILDESRITLKTLIFQIKRGLFFKRKMGPGLRLAGIFALKPSEISLKFRGPSPGNLSDFSGQDFARHTARRVNHVPKIAA
jgi:hypothetical protein